MRNVVYLDKMSLYFETTRERKKKKTCQQFVMNISRHLENDPAAGLPTRKFIMVELTDLMRMNFLFETKIVKYEVD